ncbi:MAG: copper resistance protein CopC [Chloroflexota bacterium]|nr:copper resistance protein CopC [Chloroflexota bacterium]
MRVAAAIVAFIALAALPVIALGHAELVSSDPPAGGTLTTTRGFLTATFDDELTPDSSSLVVQDAGGAQVATGNVSPGDAHVLIAELPALPEGEYTVRWTAVSADDAAVERGSYTFGVLVSIMPPPNDGEPVTDSKDPIIAVGLAAIAMIAIVAFIFFRRRR